MLLLFFARSFVEVMTNTEKNCCLLRNEFTHENYNLALFSLHKLQSNYHNPIRF